MTKIAMLLSLWCFIYLSNQAQAQTVCDLQPLKLFGKDTLAFLYKNFSDQSPLFGEGRDLKRALEEINKELPIKSFRVMKTARYDGIFVLDFYYYPIPEIKEKYRKKIKVYSIQYVFNPVFPDEPLYKKIKESGIDIAGKLMLWDNKYLKVLNELETDYLILNEYYED